MIYPLLFSRSLPVAILKGKEPIATALPALLAESASKRTMYLNNWLEKT